MKVYKRTGGGAEVVAEFDEEAGEFLHGGDEVRSILGVEEVTGDDLWESFDGPYYFVDDSGPGGSEKAETTVLGALCRIIGR